MWRDPAMVYDSPYCSRPAKLLNLLFRLEETALADSFMLISVE